VKTYVKSTVFFSSEIDTALPLSSLRVIEGRAFPFSSVFEDGASVDLASFLSSVSTFAFAFFAVAGLSSALRLAAVAGAVGGAAFPATREDVRRVSAAIIERRQGKAEGGECG
jgi:hypothetical protein